MNFKIGSGRTSLTYTAVFHGDDLHLHIDGGCSHIGSVTAAFGERVETVTFPGHKESLLTESVAKHLALALGGRVVVTAGVHLDGITKSEIERIVAQNVTMAERLPLLLQKEGNRDENRLSEQ